MLTRADLMEQLREQGIEHPSQVKRCYLEGDGRLSIIRYEAEAGNPQPRERGQ